MDLNSGLETQ